MPASRRARSRPHWGLRLPTDGRALWVDRRWRAPLVLALACTIPAFYAELLEAQAPPLAMLAYLAAARPGRLVPGAHRLAQRQA
jgi:voltage-gated potassium channel